MLSKQLLSSRNGKLISSLISQFHARCGQCSKNTYKPQLQQERFWNSSSLQKNNNINVGTCVAVQQQQQLVSREFSQQVGRKYSANVVSGEAKANNIEDEGLLKRVLNKVGFKPNSKTRLKIASHLLYESVADKVNYAYFFDHFKLPNTFNSWFLVTELHVWMLLVRGMAEGSESGEDGRFLRNSIVEALWGDVNTRAKKLGAHNPSQLRKQIVVLSEQFQAALIMYDEGIMSDDRVLAASLWRRFFEMKCDDYLKIELLVKYVRQQMFMLDSLSREELLQKPKIPWLDIAKIDT